jgi:hypothetical protein
LTDRNYLPSEPRAARLLAELDARFFSFARSLTPELQAFMLQRSTYVGSPSDARLESLAHLNPVLACAPWLFWNPFKDLEDETFLEIAYAGALTVLASLLTDHLLDGQAEEPQAAGELRDAFQAEGLRCLRVVFPPSSPFWREQERLARTGEKGFAIERRTQEKPDLFLKDAFEGMAAGKAAPVVMTLAALALLSGQEGVIEALERSVTHAVAASLLGDEVEDWGDDLACGRMTLFLYRLGLPEMRDSVATDAAGLRLALEDKIERTWLDVTQMSEAADRLEDAIDAVEGLGCPHWVDYLAHHQGLAEKHADFFILRHLPAAFDL